MDFGSSGDSKSPNLEDLMRLGARTAKAGNRQNARVIFQQVLDVDKRHERAWLWMASLAETNVDRRRYLETVLKLNPNNQTAAKQLAQMDKAVQSSEGRSVRLGIIIIVGLITAIVIVGAVILLVTTIQRF